MGERKNLWGREGAGAIGNFLSSFISPNRYSFKEGEASKDEFERFRGFFYAREEVEITIGSI